MLLKTARDTRGLFVITTSTMLDIKTRKLLAHTARAASWRERVVRGLAGLTIITGCALASAGSAHAQNWWPFGGNEPQRPPVPREPVYRNDAPPPAPIPPQPPQATPQGGPPAVPQASGGQSWGTKNPICLQLEQRLVQEGQKGNQSRDILPKIETEIRQVDRTYNVGATQLDRSCYEYFLFTKSFRATPQCRELVKQVEGAKRRLAELEAQRQDIIGTGGRSYQDDIVRELARNNCGANYADQARRRDGGMWQDEESIGGGTWTPQNPTGVATYRTLCVRLCDGYYFPVSFSTLPSHFPQDAEVCTAKCAAPTELYYYPNPGGSVDQSVALTSQDPYTKLKSAFRYRKEYVNGCSCKEADYDEATATLGKKADATGVDRGTARKTSAAAAPVETAPLSQPITTGALPPGTPAEAPSSGEPASAAEAPALGGQNWQPQ